MTINDLVYIDNDWVYIGNILYLNVLQRITNNCLLYHDQMINSIGKKKPCSFDFIMWPSMINNALLWSSFFEHKGQMRLSALPFSRRRTALLYGSDRKPRGREIWRTCTMSSITFTFLILQLISNFILVNLVSDTCFNHLAFQISGIFLIFYLLQVFFWQIIKLLLNILFTEN